jgi:dienelactone hydrolase
MSDLRIFDYRHGDLVLKGQLAIPAGAGPHPGVLVMHDARGLGEQVRRRAVLLAQQGYVALATDMYGGGQYFENPRESGPLVAALYKEPRQLRARVLAAFDALRTLPEVDGRRIGAIGFCFGGLCVLELARSGADAKAVASFHGLLTSQLPASPQKITAKILAMTGARDPYVPKEHVDAFQKEMTAAGADWQTAVYGEGWHAFTDSTAGPLKDIPGVRYDPLLDRLSWAQALEFLAATLG